MSHKGLRRGLAQLIVHSQEKPFGSDRVTLHLRLPGEAAAMLVSERRGEAVRSVEVLCVESNRGFGGNGVARDTSSTSKSRLAAR